MSIKNPDILQHENSKYASLDVNDLRGVSIVPSILARNSIDIDKRRIGALVSVEGISVYQYRGLTVSNTDWENQTNWKPLIYDDTDNIVRFFTYNSDIVNGCGSDFKFVCSVQTGHIYRYVQDGVSFVVDNFYVLPTLDGGDTRFVSILYYVGTSGTESDITATIAAGGVSISDVIPAGTTLQEFIQILLAPYVSSSFSAFTVNFDVASTVEVGRTVTVTNATWTAVNDSEGNPPYNKTIIGTGFIVDTPVVSSPHTADAVVKTVQRTTSGSSTWTIQGYDKNNVVKTRTSTKTWYHLFKFGANPTLVTDSTSAQNVYNALQQSWLQANLTRTVTCTADNNNTSNYTYIIFDRTLAQNLTDVKLGGVESVLGAFIRVGEFLVTNTYGVESLKVVYQTSAKGAFSSGQTLAIN
jgi:hypothetical protein